MTASRTVFFYLFDGIISCLMSGLVLVESENYVDHSNGEWQETS